MSLNTSNIGAIGEHAVIMRLLELEYDVFKDVTGSNSVDLVAHKNGQFKRIQVKTTSSKDGAVSFPRYVSGREIKQQLQGCEFDVMAVYVRDRNLCLFMNIDELLVNKTGVSVRIDSARNGAKKNVRMFESYLQV